MPVSRAKRVSFDASGFKLDDTLRDWLAREFPRVDPDKTVELFGDKAMANGYRYASWPHAFKNYVRNGEKYGGLAYRRGMADPAFDHLVKRAHSIGFRSPLPHESAGVYRTALDTFDKTSAVRQGSMFKDVLKRVPK